MLKGRLELSERLCGGNCSGSSGYHKGELLLRKTTAHVWEVEYLQTKPCLIPFWTTLEHTHARTHTHTQEFLGVPELILFFGRDGLVWSPEFP